MKRKVFACVIVIAVLAGIVFIGYKIYHTIQAKNTAEKNTATLPAFTFSTVSNQPFSNTAIENNKIIINYFNPDCEHCQYMAQSLAQHANDIKDIQILMVTIADSATVVKFAGDYGINTLPNITLLLDKNFRFGKIFGTTTVPSFFVYRDKKLVKKIIGETKIENLLND
jgi:thiol-disulfide isomerase/thioredoxin